MSNIGIFIPARLNSTRLKEKMLLEIDGVPLIREVYDKVRSYGFTPYVLTDSDKIASLIPENCIIPGEYENGTARIASIVDNFNFDSYINVQGDLLDVSKELIDKTIDNLGYNGVVTAYSKNKSSVRVIHDNENAHWFTRKDLGYGDYHIGIYGYSAHALRWYRDIEPSVPEKLEDLEQLRFFKGYEISVFEYNYKGREINTNQDL